jgi:hypothetical protein
MAEACKISDDQKVWRKEFEEFLGHIFKWSEAHGDAVSKCFITYTSEGLKCFVVTTGENYRFDFDDEVVNLELRLTQVYPRCPVEVLQMPSASNDALSSFFLSDKSFQVYGQPEAASGEGGSDRKLR